MNKELETYFNNYFGLFRNEGWKQLLEELTSNALAINNIDATKDESDLHFRKGQLNVLKSIINFEPTIQNAFDEANSEESVQEDD